VHPIAPTTIVPRSSTVAPPLRPRTPATVSPSKISSCTEKFSRNSAPASTAKSMRILSSTVRRGQYAARSSAPGNGGGENDTSPKCIVVLRRGGQLVAATASSTPHFFICRTPVTWM
jgi:hypothetical protein